MSCCGTPHAVAITITVETSLGVLALQRCSHCDNQEWLRDGITLPRATALNALATAYQDVPLRARAARDRAATASAARRAARVAATAQNAARTQSTSAAQVRGDRRDRDLRELLSTWTVLGSAS